ncbi:hypothetical protein [Methylobacterium sp. J-092]|uniref:hypothetical protein n=1 Tax=Methylobacterium sp. J-092 TaxID=2836667 RepID=UPI001FBB93B8|nr:hypothetical protein [Methylobacterium sp. J-092]MCJ2005628.1 hypothetical protein [Methylobacterium sp. J-092]
MSNVITFSPRGTAPHVPPAPSPAETRRMIEEAAQTVLDTVDSLLAILDRMDGDAEAEDGTDAEPTPAAPESQVVRLRNNDSDRKAQALKLAMPEVAAPHAGSMLATLPWGGRGNVIAAAGTVLLDMVARR